MRAVKLNQGLERAASLWLPDQAHLIRFLKINLVLLAFMAAILGAYRFIFMPIVGWLNMTIVMGTLFLYLWVDRKPSQAHLISNLLLVSSLAAATAVYLALIDNPVRVGLFFPVLISAFYFKGFKTSRYWLGVIVFILLSGQLQPWFDIGYSNFEIFATCAYLVLTFSIIWNFELTRQNFAKHEREAELQRLVDQRWRVAMESAGDAVWDWDIQSDDFEYSKRYTEMLGYAESELGHTSQIVTDLLHAEDRARVMQHLQEYLEGDFSNQYAAEHRLRCKDGSYKWVLCRGRVMGRNANGRPARMFGTSVDITERKLHEKQLQEIAHFDALTGVPNRVLLADRLVQALARAKRERGLMAVCYLDLDGFKPINDNYGHDVGDQVLVEITRRIKNVIREDDTVARLGGDEFVVLLVGMQAPEECAGSLNRLLEIIHQPIQLQADSIRISASIGVALYPEDNHDPDTLLRHADQAMYVAKQSGKNHYHLFDSTNDLRTRSHHEFLMQIRNGLAQGEFELYYQPKVELLSHHLVGAEALLRWNHPTRGLLLPSEFLRLIENTGMEIELGDWVIATAIAQQQRWRKQGLCIELSINVSAYHLQSPGFSEKVRAIAQACCPEGCAGVLQIEVLETAALEDVAGVVAIIAECKVFGMAFALDDFGTGYSSMSYLSKFDVDVLKIDQSFVRDMLEDKGDHAIVQGIIALSKAFEMSIVAEGVETAAQYQALLQMGCSVGQGYGIARPMKADALIAWGQAV